MNWNSKKEMKTVKEWLLELPDWYRERALKNMKDFNVEVSKMTIAIDWFLKNYEWQYDLVYKWYGVWIVKK